MREDNIYRLGRRFFKYRTLGMGAGSLMIFSFYFLYDALVIPRFPYLKGAPLTVLFLLVEMAFLYLLQWGAKRVAERTYYQVRADGLVFVNGRKQKIYLWKDFEQVEEELQTKMLRLDDMDTLLDEFADVAYDKAVDVVTDAVRSETQNADIRMVDAVQKTEIAKCADNSAKQKLINRIMTNLKQKMLGAASAITKRITDVLRDPEVKQNGKEEIKKAIKPSVMDMLARARNQADAYNSSRKSNQEQRYRGPEL